jgi:hypothetical protein
LSCAGLGLLTTTMRVSAHVASLGHMHANIKAIE